MATSRTEISFGSLRSSPRFIKLYNDTELATMMASVMIGRALIRNGRGRIFLWQKGSLIHPVRNVSSNSTEEVEQQPDRSVGPELVLYQRQNTSNTIGILQSGLFFSSFHTAYWVWYVTDFLPLVNASPMEQLHIDPLWGYAGLAMAITLNGIFVVFPKRFISKVMYRPKLQELAVFTYQMPLMRPSAFASRFPVGDQVKTVKRERQASDYFRLDREHAKTILEQHDGDISKFRGHLIVGRQWPRYSMDIQSDNDVVDPQLLLEILLRPEYFQLEGQGDVEDHDDYGVGTSPSSRRFRSNSRRSGRIRSRPRK